MFMATIWKLMMFLGALTKTWMLTMTAQAIKPNPNSEEVSMSNILLSFKVSVFVSFIKVQVKPMGGTRKSSGMTKAL